MENKIDELKARVKLLQEEVDQLQSNGLDNDGPSGSSLNADNPQPLPAGGKYKGLAERLERLEGNLGVEKVVLTDIGDKIQVVVQTPLGSVIFPLGQTPNSAKLGKSKGQSEVTETSSTLGIAHQGIGGPQKSAPPAGMTPEQVQDFKKQSLQINTLQQKIKDLETKLAEANVLIKKGGDITMELDEKEFGHVKEIYQYLDNINTTMSEKIAEQREEMKKLAGDVPQPINYDPFNYGEAYAGDIVDFDSRKRIVEIQLLLEGIVTAMSQMKDSTKQSPSIDLGYKVVRLDQLLTATGFGQAVLNGEVNHENGLLLHQAPNIEPPEIKYPRNEIFQTDESKESTWAMTDSIMQTMYRLEVELGQLQNLVGTLDVGSHVKDLQELVSSVKDGKGKEVDEAALVKLVEKECKHVMARNNAMSKKVNHTKEESSSRQSHFSMLSSMDVNSPVLNDVKKVISSLKSRIEAMEMNHIQKDDSGSRKTHHKGHHKCMSCDNKVAIPVFQSRERTLPKMPFFSPYTAPRMDGYYRQPVRLRTLMQRVYRYQSAEPNHDVYRMPRPHGGNYAHNWPRPQQDVMPQEELTNEKITSFVVPASKEYLVKGKDGHWYKGDSMEPRSPLN